MYRALAEAIRKGEALIKLIEEEEDHADASDQDSGSDDQDFSIHNGSRELLIKMLGMLGSEHAGERAAAALMAEKQRIKLGKTWPELIVREDDDDDEDDDEQDDLDDDNDDDEYDDEYDT